MRIIRLQMSVDAFYARMNVCWCCVCLGRRSPRHQRIEVDNGFLSQSETNNICLLCLVLHLRLCMLGVSSMPNGHTNRAHRDDFQSDANESWINGRKEEKQPTNGTIATAKSFIISVFITRSLSRSITATAEATRIPPTEWKAMLSAVRRRRSLFEHNTRLYTPKICNCSTSIWLWHFLV